MQILEKFGKGKKIFSFSPKLKEKITFIFLKLNLNNKK